MNSKKKSSDSAIKCHEIIATGFLFDIYNTGDTIHLWIIDDNGTAKMFMDRHHPEIFIHGNPDIARKFIRRLNDLHALSVSPQFVKKRLFYENREIEVIRLKISNPDVLRKIKKTQHVFYRKLDIYHSDIEIPTSYMSEKKLHPMGRIKIASDHNGFIKKIIPLDSITDLDYRLPDLRIMRITLEKGHRIPINQNAFLININGHNYRLTPEKPDILIKRLNHIIRQHDPDVILSFHGDDSIFPFLFEVSQNNNLFLALDRDTLPPVRRAIKRKGSSYMTYGSWIYSAPSYPLFGRWHIDTKNSFVYKETELGGVIELARLSRIPVQKLARSSTGSALTSIETETAINMNYLVPWQKSAVEDVKTAGELLNSDRGGIVFSPYTDEGYIYENVAQLDFSQMYPTIMHIHNISPETINCLCCNNHDSISESVPTAGYRICQKRRGVVSESLKHILERRTYYKKKSKENLPEKTAKLYNAKQESLKWMLVTSFGYLGYRNAKFGRLESHESVTSFGREKILKAKEIAENSGYQVLHAITDCIFIKKENGYDRAGEPPKESKINPKQDLIVLAEEITRNTGIQMSIDGIFSWLIFFPSRTRKDTGVSTRYAGRYIDGGLKVRGIASRRKDTCEFIKEFQKEILSVMERCETVKYLNETHPVVHKIFRKYENYLFQSSVHWKDLLIRKTVTKSREDYSVQTGTSESAEQLAQMNIELSPGEKIRYLVVQGINSGRNKKRSSYLSEEKAILMEMKGKTPIPDVSYYHNQLHAAYKEIHELFSPPFYFKTKPLAEPTLFTDDPEVL